MDQTCFSMPPVLFICMYCREGIFFMPPELFSFLLFLCWFALPYAKSKWSQLLKDKNICECSSVVLNAKNTAAKIQSNWKSAANISKNIFIQYSYYKYGVRNQSTTSPVQHPCCWIIFYGAALYCQAELIFRKRERAREWINERQLS